VQDVFAKASFVKTSFVNVCVPMKKNVHSVLGKFPRGTISASGRWRTPPRQRHFVQALRVCSALVVGIALTTPGDAAPSKTRVFEKARASERQSDRNTSKTATTRATLPAGPLQIMISLREQRLTVYSAGAPIASSAVSSGQTGFETPAGIYSILQKNRHHESNIYSDAPMPYMQRITWSGIALHEGNLPGYPASHGCIRLPGAFASTLFGMTKVGARVIVARDPLTPRPFAHEKLVKPKAPVVPVTLAQLSAVRSAAASTAATGDGGSFIDTAVAMPRSLERSASTTRAPDDGQVAILISRQTGKIYIRRNFQPVYEGDIDIQDPELPLGTHLYTAVGYNSDQSEMTWNVVTFPSNDTKPAGKNSRVRFSDIERADVAAGVQRTWVTPPGAALERIAFEPDVLEEIAEIARPGMSLMITDRGPSQETGKGTEFVIQTR
jgi:hypothetical protein